MIRLLRSAAVLEGITGLVLVVDTTFFLKLLLGDGADGKATAIGRLTGIALLGLATACWPTSHAGSSIVAPLRAMLAYNVAVTIYLGVLGFTGQAAGSLLWPAVVVHAVLTILFCRNWFSDSLTQQTK